MLINPALSSPCPCGRGARLGGGTPRQADALYRYGKYIGLLFQLVDDIMDNQGYVRVIGLKEPAKS